MPAITYNIKTDFGAVGDGVANDAPAFAAFQTAALAWQTTHSGQIELDIPAGTYLFASTAANTWLYGIINVVVVGSGSVSFIDDGNTDHIPFFGTRGLIADGVTNSLFETVSSGTTTLQLKTPSEISRFSDGQWVLMSCVDLQGVSGYPPAAGIFEYKQIQSRNVGAGTITFASGLTYSYKSTYPNYWRGDPANSWIGGPATIYSLPSNWDADIEFQGIGFNFSLGIIANGRSVTFRNCTVGANCGITPSQNLTWQAIGCNSTAASFDFDKLTDTVLFDSCSLKRATIPTSSENNITFRNTTFTVSLEGTGSANTLITGCTIPSITVGISQFGCGRNLTITDTAVSSGISPAGAIESHIELNWTMTNGVMRANLATHDAVNWAIPGRWYFFGSANIDHAVIFQVTDLTTDGTYVYVHTNLGAGFPAITLGANGLQVYAHPAQSFTCAGGSGADIVDLNQHTPGRPIYSYTRRQYNSQVRTAPTVPIWGYLGSCTIDVTRAYSGSLGPVQAEIAQGGTNTIKPDYSTYFYDPIVNDGLIGTRTLTPTTANGALSGDTLPTPGTIWLSSTIAPFFNPNTSGESAAANALMFIEIVTDQGIPPDSVIGDNRQVLLGAACM